MVTPVLEQLISKSAPLDELNQQDQSKQHFHNESDDDGDGDVDDNGGSDEAQSATASAKRSKPKRQQQKQQHQQKQHQQKKNKKTTKAKVRPKPKSQQIAPPESPQQQAQRQLAWRAVSALLHKLDGPLLQQAVNEALLLEVTRQAHSPKSSVHATRLWLLEHLLLTKLLKCSDAVWKSVKALLVDCSTRTRWSVHKVRIECLRQAVDIAIAGRLQPERFAVTPPTGTDLLMGSGSKKTDVPLRVSVRAARSTPGLRIAHCGRAIYVLNDTDLYLTVYCTHALTSGKWYYELELLMDTPLVVGFASDKCTARPDPEAPKGVGDDSESYSYAGNRSLRFHDGATPYGEPSKWKVGEVVGCCYNADAGEISFSLNNQPLGLAFENVKHAGGIMPAVSLTKNSACSLWFDQTRYRPPAGYRTLNDVTVKSKKKRARAIFNNQSLARVNTFVSSIYYQLCRRAASSDIAPP